MCLASIGAAQNSGGFPVTVHVYAAHWFTTLCTSGGGDACDLQSLDITIGGKKFQILTSDYRHEIWLMKLGDYKARLVKDAHKPTGETHRVYELLLPNGQTRRFVVVGESE